ncbi:MAG: hypothetical protein ACTS3F_08270 [Phycisphaerales bacterium]
MRETTFVPINRAAAALGVPKAWLIRMVAVERIPAVRAGRRWLVPLEETRARLVELADSGKAVPHGDA